MKKIQFLIVALVSVVQVSVSAPQRKTVLSIKGESFYINKTVTFKGKTWRGYSIEGLLPNSRMVNGILDDETDSTRYRWAYPDTKKWDVVSDDLNAKH